MGLATGLSCAVLTVPALAAGPTIVATPNPVSRGTVVRVHGVVPGCPRGDQITLLSKAFSKRHEFAGVPAVYARVGAHAAYSVSTRIPASLTPGSYRITGRCGGGNLGVSRTLRVQVLKYY
jgi:hypothetical protein